MCVLSPWETRIEHPFFLFYLIGKSEMDKRLRMWEGMTLGERAWEVMQNWYRDAYEDISKECLQLRKSLSFFQDKLSKMQRSRENFRQSAEIATMRCNYYQQELREQRAIITEIYELYPEIREHFNVSYVSETDSEVTRELNFDNL